MKNNFHTGFHPTERRWFAVRTSFRHEKQALKDLKRMDIEGWLPLITITRFYVSKRREVQLPLINSYLFVHISQSEYIRVLESQYISCFVHFGKEIVSIPDEEIAFIRLVVGEAKIVAVSPRELLPGDQVEIIGGRLTGLIGVIEDKKKNHLVSISLDRLGFTFTMDVDLKYIRKLKGRQIESA
jgi:transcriptional antiterminator RfaH